MPIVISKRDPLTESQLSAYELYEEIWRYLEECRVRLGLRPDETRVLDWGCGRGEAVIRLRDRGYDAVGIDIEREYIENGRSLLRARGKDADSILKVISPPAQTNLAEGRFHFVFSDQVLEHVEGLEEVVSEIARVTSPGGVGFHSFPAHRHPLEDHLRMPFVHYLPKNRVRYCWTVLCVLLGMEPRWSHLRNASRLERARAYYEYSIRSTYYRRPSEIRRAFARARLDARFVTIEKASWRRSALARRLAGSRFGLRLVEWALLTFRSVEILTVKPPEPPASTVQLPVVTPLADSARS